MRHLPVMRPAAPALDSVKTRLEQIDATRWYTNLGPQEHELRRRFAARLRVAAEQVATAANATLCLAGAVAVLGGKRWLAPTFTFPATPGSILAAGAEVVLGDIHPQTWALVPQDGFDGAMPVAPFGAPPDVDTWASAGGVVHDAAASLGEDLDLSPLRPGQAVVFSLHATKVLGAGEGGIVVFGDPVDATRFRSWTNHGFTDSREAEIPGINAKMSEVQCAYVHAALDGWAKERKEWEEARSAVMAMLDRSGVEVFTSSRRGINPYLIARFDDEDVTRRVEATFEGHGIETRRWWSRGCHRMPAYRRAARGTYPVAERAAAESLGLPFFRGLGSHDIDRIGTALDAALAGS